MIYVNLFLIYLIFEYFYKKKNLRERSKVSYRRRNELNTTRSRVTLLLTTQTTIDSTTTTIA